jgi:hypothetical protein
MLPVTVGAPGVEIDVAGPAPKTATGSLLIKLLADDNIAEVDDELIVAVTPGAQGATLAAHADLAP